MEIGLMQLVRLITPRYHLAGRSSNNIFKVVYRRYTNFSIESIRQTFNAQVIDKWDWWKIKNHGLYQEMVI